MILQIENLHVKYGQVEVLFGISLNVKKGEIAALLGANGAGKSTTLAAVSGLLKSSAGVIRFEGDPINRLPAHEIVRRGVTQVPEGRRIFGTLTVQENLDLGAFTYRDSRRIEQTRSWIFEDLFPVLKERRHQLGGTLSGGEQQMLAIARALMAHPKILLLDEPSLGLAPLLARTIFQTLRKINASGVTILLIEQNARAALKLAHRGYVMDVGKIVLEDSADALLTNPHVQKAYMSG